MKTKKILLLVLLFGIFLVFFGAQAIAPKPLEQAPYPEALGRELEASSTLPDLVAYLYNFAIMIAGIAVFFMLVIGGFKYLTSAGDPGKIKEAKDQLTSSILGLVLLLSSYLILNLINPQLTTLIEPGKKITPQAPGVTTTEAVGLVNAIALFKHAGFGEPSFILTTSTPNFADEEFKDGSGANDQISSVMLREDVHHAILCLAANFENCGYFDTDVENLKKVSCRGTCGSNISCDWNDGISSARVGKAEWDSPCEGAVLYDCSQRTINYRDGKNSKFFEVLGGCVNLANTPIGNDAVSSLSMSGRCKVTLYKDANCSVTGEYASFGGAYGATGLGTDYTCEDGYNCIADLRNYPCSTCGGGEWHDDASSVRVTPLP